MSSNNTDSPQNLPQLSESAIPSPSVELFEKGIQKYEENDILGAIEIYENLASTNPELIEAQVNLGNSYFMAGRMDDAIAVWQKVLQVDSSHINCYINIGNAYYIQKKVHEAIEKWQLALAMAPNHPTVLLNLGAAYEKLGDKVSAFNYYGKYLTYCQATHSGDFYQIHKKVTTSQKMALKCLNLGVKYQRRKNLRTATKYYLKSISIYPNYSKSHLNLGNICYIAEKYEHAIKYWIESIKIEPEHYSTYLNMAIAYEKIKKYTYAYAMYTRFLTKSAKQEVSEKSSVKERMGILLTLMTQEDIQSHISMGDKLFKEQMYFEAVLEYENFLIIKPEQKNLVEGKIKQSNDLLNPEKVAAKKAYDIGLACYKQKKYDKAIQAFKRYLYFDANGDLFEEVYAKMEECNKLLANAE